MRRLALAALFLAACAHKHAAGDACSIAEAYCEDGRTSLACRDGKLATFKCNGPKGCYSDAERTVFCDQSQGAQLGELCFPEYNGYGQCTSRGTTYVFCADGRWKEMACPRDAACVVTAQGISCQLNEVK